MQRKSLIKTGLLLFLIISILCFLSVLIFTGPAFIDRLNVSEKGNIGDAIGGITAPILGIFSSMLLYAALTRQTESNIDQRIKNESDIIFLMINQMEKELESLYETHSITTHRLVEGLSEKTTTEHRFHGIEALDNFVRKLNEMTFESFKYTFNSFYQSKQILLIVNTFELIDKRIEVAFFSEDLKTFFEAKMKSFYSCRIRSALKRISELVTKHPNIADHVSTALVNFYNQKEARYKEPEDY